MLFMQTYDEFLEALLLDVHFFAIDMNVEGHNGSHGDTH